MSITLKCKMELVPKFAFFFGTCSRTEPWNKNLLPCVTRMHGQPFLLNPPFSFGNVRRDPWLYGAGVYSRFTRNSSVSSPTSDEDQAKTNDVPTKAGGIKRGEDVGPHTSVSVSE